MGKIFSRGLLAIYLLVLIWLVLFKLSPDMASVLELHHRGLNLIPFAAPQIVNGQINYAEMIYNCIFFIPFGLLLQVNFKKIKFWPKLAMIGLFSLSAELIQYIFAIGVTDITDLITNTLGGFLGLILYDLCKKYMHNEKLDRVIVSMGILLLILFLSMHASHYVLK